MSNANAFNTIGVKDFWRRRGLKKALKYLQIAVKLIQRYMDVNGGTLATFDYIDKRIAKELEDIDVNRRS